MIKNFSNQGRKENEIFYLFNFFIGVLLFKINAKTTKNDNPFSNEYTTPFQVPTSTNTIEALKKGSDGSMVLYKKFSGRNPKLNALIQRLRFNN